jgi:hypothetical protein
MEADSGGQRAASLYSLIGTAKLSGLDPAFYLRTVVGHDRRASDQPHRTIPVLEHRCLTPDRLFASRLDPLNRCPLKNKWTPVGLSYSVKRGTSNDYTLAAD